MQSTKLLKDTTFCVITQAENRVTVQTGTVGTNGESSDIHFDSPEQAEAYYKQVIEERHKEEFEHADLVGEYLRYRYFENAATNQFWTIGITDKGKLASRSGKIGHPWKTALVSFAKIEEEFQKAVDTKLHEGFEEIGI